LLTSSFQTTADVPACIPAGAVSTISVAALLELAHWCHQHRITPSSGEPCPTPSTALCPPVGSSDPAGHCSAPALGTPEPRPTDGSGSTAGRTAQPAPAPTHTTGADQ
jgi:hypothetical protein